MKSSRKVIILIPPLLIGVTVLLVVFSYQYQKIQGTTNAIVTETPASTMDVVVTAPLPDAVSENPGPSPDESTSTTVIACTAEAKQCPDGSYVGRSGPNCEFAECESGVSRGTLFCSEESREAEVCAEIYAPVCADLKVECITAPCEPVPTDYVNSCFACAEERVQSYISGECASS